MREGGRKKGKGKKQKERLKVRPEANQHLGMTAVSEEAISVLLRRYWV